jgi:ubiquinone/menaquinone biosynthesis C-methylase UbiE
VLNLSAGGTAQQFNNVLEAEAAVFRHTDILVDAHCLPFADGAFAAILVMNAFEHYREPKRVAGELFRVLRPGGQVLIHTAFLQPLRHCSTEVADDFTNSSLGHLSSLWRGTEETRSADLLWSALAQLPQEAQEGIAAGFEYLGRRPHD